MNIHELVRELREPADTKIVLLVADGIGGLPLEPGGKTELETASHPNLDDVRPGRGERAERPRPARDHPRQRAGAPGAVRLRPAGIPHRPRHPRSPGDQLSGRAEGRGGPGELLHPRPGRQDHRPPGRPADHRAVRRTGQEDAGHHDPRGRGVRRAGEGAPVRAGVPRRRAGRDVNDTDPQQVGLEPLQAAPVRQQTAGDATEPDSAKTAASANEFVAEGAGGA